MKDEVQLTRTATLLSNEGRQPSKYLYEQQGRTEPVERVEVMEISHGDVRVSQRPRGRNMGLLSGIFTQTGPRKACASGGGGAGILILLVVGLTEVMLMVMVLTMIVVTMVAMMVMAVAVLEVTVAVVGVMPMDSSW